MRKTLSTIAAVVLALGMFLPSAALAKGKPDPKPDKAERVAAKAEVKAAKAEVKAAKAAEKAAEAEVKAEAKAERKALKAAEKAERRAAEAPEAPEAPEALEGEDPAVDEPDAEVEEPSEDATPPARATGIANALSRIQANLQRQAAKRSKVSTGLTAVVRKFMSWLGLSPDEPPVVEPPVVEPPADDPPAEEPSTEETLPPAPVVGEDGMIINPYVPAP